MSRGRAYNIWKSRLKYISRLNKNLYWWRIENGVTYNVFGDKIPRFTRPRNWKELDGGNRHAKLLKKTCALYKDNWKKVEERLSNKRMRIEGKRIKEYEEEMQYEMPVFSQMS